MRGEDEGQATVAALLRAGRELFARRGYDGASVRAITAAAGANLGAITYHFGSKRAFYDRVVESCLLPLAERVEAIHRGGGSAFDRIGEIVASIIDHVLQVPELPRLMMQELAVGREPPAAAVAPVRRILSVLSSLVRSGQASGAIRPGDPLILAISIVSHPIHIGLVQSALPGLTGLDLDDPSVRARVRENAVAFVRGGLAAAGAAGEEVA